jgi:hypothetical protein
VVGFVLMFVSIIVIVVPYNSSKLFCYVCVYYSCLYLCRVPLHMSLSELTNYIVRVFFFFENLIITRLVEKLGLSCFYVT